MVISNRLMTGCAAAALLWFSPASAQDGAEKTSRTDRLDEIVVTGTQLDQIAGTKTATPLIETPQPITVVTEDAFRAQGALSISDTLRYVAGVTSNAYGLDSRVDSSIVRGVSPLQFRDGMRDIFSFYASIVADPYNFSRVEVVRGPASVLFGQGSLGGIINLVSKAPTFETHGEASLVYGSFDRKEALFDLTGPITDTIAARMVGRVRDSGTQVDTVPDDRVMLSPSIRWRPNDGTDLTLIGLYQEDDLGSTAQFLPIVGTLRPNPGNPRLPNTLFVGDPVNDRYDGRLLQGTATLVQRFGDAVTLNLKARYIDSDLTYITHYPNSYSNSADPYIAGSNGRQIGLYGDGSVARLNIFSTDNNVQFDFSTGSAVRHTLLGGVDYSWNAVRKRGGSSYDIIDLYAIDYGAISTPTLNDYATEESQKQLGFYLQDQIRLWDRVSVVLGVRHDDVRSKALAQADRKDSATTFRAGVIGEVGAGISPFFSYTESFLPVAGSNSQGQVFLPQRGRQFETGLKWQPDRATLVTVTGFHITEINRPVSDPSTPDPFDQTQSGELTTQGIEVEAIRTLPGKFDVTANYAYNDVTLTDPAAFDYVPRHNASLWTTKTFPTPGGAALRLGAGVRYTGESTSGTIVTPDYTLVDALASITWDSWRFSLNATNLLGEKFYASCLSRGDCFIGAERNVMGTLAFRF